MFRVEREMLIDLGEHRRVFVAHENGHGERVDASLQRVGGPGMPERVEAILGNKLGSAFVAELRLGFMAKLGRRFS